MTAGRNDARSAHKCLLSVQQALELLKGAFKVGFDVLSAEERAAIVSASCALDRLVTQMLVSGLHQENLAEHNRRYDRKVARQDRRRKARAIVLAQKQVNTEST